jgi:6-hydroxy-3-succinoylpyridine 3-monooxygenase
MQPIGLHFFCVDNMAKKRSIIYIDGFNLYYGAVKGTKWKWLNLERYFTLLRQDDDIQSIKYFTALIDGSHRANQETYLLALSTLPKVQIFQGNFKLKNVECRVAKCTFSGNKFFKVPEEKHTDVNIALHMLYDAMNNNFDRLVLISGDSDLVPALRMVKYCTPEKEIIVYVPANVPIRGAAVEIRSAADKHKILPNILLEKSQFPPKIKNGFGSWITKPPSW